MADKEFIEGLKELIGKTALFKVKRMRHEDDDPVNPKFGFYVYDFTGVVEKVELFTQSKLPEPPMCVFVKNKNEYNAINVDRIVEVDDAPPIQNMPSIAMDSITRPNIS